MNWIQTQSACLWSCAFPTTWWTTHLLGTRLLVSIHALGHRETIQFSYVWWLGQSGSLCVNYHLAHFCLFLHTSWHLALKTAHAVVFANRLFSSFHPMGCSFLISSLIVGAWFLERGRSVILQTAKFLHSL